MSAPKSQLQLKAHEALSLRRGNVAGLWTSPFQDDLLAFHYLPRSCAGSTVLYTERGGHTTECALDSRPRFSQRVVCDDGTVLCCNDDANMWTLTAYDRDGELKCSSKVICRSSSTAFVLPSPTCAEIFVLCFVHKHKDDIAQTWRLFVLDAEMLSEKQAFDLALANAACVTLVSNALSPDGRLLALSGYDLSEKSNCIIAFIDLSQRLDPGRTALDVVPITKPSWTSPTSLTFSPDGNRLLFSDVDALTLLLVPTMRVVSQIEFESIGPLFFLQDPDCSSERALVCTITLLRGNARVVVIDMLRNGEVVAEAGTRGGVHLVRVDKRGIIHCLVHGADGENVVHRFELV